MKFVLTELVILDSAKEGGGAKCSFEGCAQKFTTARKDTVKKHYKRAHKTTFLEEVKASVKKPSGQMIRVPFSSSADVSDFCLQLQIHNNLPFKFWNSAPWRVLGAALEEAFKMTINQDTMCAIVHKAYKSMVSELKSALQKRIFSIKFDIGKRQSRNILGINVQYCDENFKTVIKTLAMVEIQGSATSENLEEVVKTVLRRYELSTEQLYSVTTDNANNVLKTAKLLMDSSSQQFMSQGEDINPFPEHRIRCAAHVVQLAVKDFMVAHSEIVDQANEAGRRIRKLIANKTVTGIKKPAQANETRWSSTYDLFKDLVHLRKDRRLLGPMGSINWDILIPLEAVLQPLAELTTKLQAEQYLMGCLLIDLMVCEEKLERINTAWSQKILADLIRRRAMIMSSDVFLAGLYLDPRINCKGSQMMTKSQKAIAFVSFVFTIL